MAASRAPRRELTEGPSASRTFPGAPSSPGQARAFIRETLELWSLSALEDTLVLLVSELSTNVVLHARTSYDVSLMRLGDVLRLTVLDDSPAGPAPRRAALRSATGRGLALVQTLALDWGRTEDLLLHGHAKGIWCEVSAEPAEEAVAEGAMYGEDWLALLDEPAEV